MLKNICVAATITAEWGKNLARVEQGQSDNDLSMVSATRTVASVTGTPTRLKEPTWKWSDLYSKCRNLFYNLVCFEKVSMIFEMCVWVTVSSWEKKDSVLYKHACKVGSSSCYTYVTLTIVKVWRAPCCLACFAFCYEESRIQSYKAPATY